MCLSNGWLVEAHYLRLFLRLSRIAHFTTFQKFTDRINYSLLEKIISSFIVISGTKRIFVGIDRLDRIQEGMITHASLHYYSARTGRRRKYAKLSNGADVLQQIICNIRIRRAPTRHDNNIDFKPIVKRIANTLPLSMVTGDESYDSSEDNHLLVRDDLCIPYNPSSI